MLECKQTHFFNTRKLKQFSLFKNNVAVKRCGEKLKDRIALKKVLSGNEKELKGQTENKRNKEDHHKQESFIFFILYPWSTQQIIVTKVSRAAELV